MDLDSTGGPTSKTVAREVRTRRHNAGVTITTEDAIIIKDILSFETDSRESLENTLDYFDENLGVLTCREEPTRAEFACSLLREVLLALTEPSVLREKVKLGALLLHLSTATQEFDWLYKYYHQVID